MGIVVKVCFVMIVLNGDPVLREAISVLKPYGKVVVAEGPVGWFAQKGITTSTDETNAILQELLPPENIVHGQFSEKDEMMNALAPLIPDDTTHCWMVDSDEVWRAEQIEKILPDLDNYDSVDFKPDTFFGGFERILSGFEVKFTWYRIQRWYPGAVWQHRPPTISAPDGRPWREHRHWAAPYRFAHYSYVFPHSVKAKWEYYQARDPKRVIQGWFQNVWLRWVLGNDIARRIIEDEYHGVHEWKPSARGDCYTQKFTGTHPPQIMEAMPRLEARFQRELEAYA